MRLLKMSNLAAIFLLSLVNGATFSANAQSPLEALTADQIRTHLFGTTMTGEYPSGQGWAERFNEDGTSSYSQDGILSEGSMSFQGNTLCFTYPDKPLTGGCFEVWKRSKNCFDFYAMPTTVPFTARRFSQNWDARAWYSNQTGTCVSELIS